MKRFSLVIVTVLIAAAVYSQPKSGSMYVGGDVSFWSTGQKFKAGAVVTEGDKSFDLTILPHVGYYLSDNLAIGAKFGYSSVKYTTPSIFPAGSDEDLTSKMHIEPYARYYLINNTGGLFIEGGLGLAFGKNTTTNTVTGPPVVTTIYEEKLLDVTLGIRPGVYYHITPNLALESTFGFIGYVMNKHTDPAGANEVINNQMGVNIGMSTFLVGLVYTLE